jgi:hypothetical protein
MEQHRGAQKKCEDFCCISHKIILSHPTLTRGISGVMYLCAREVIAGLSFGRRIASN